MKKTPIQELIETFKEIQKDQEPFTVHEAIELAELLLPKEEVNRRELLLYAICEYNKYNTQKNIKAVDDWLKDWDSK